MWSSACRHGLTPPIGFCLRHCRLLSPIENRVGIMSTKRKSGDGGGASGGRRPSDSRPPETSNAATKAKRKSHSTSSQKCPSSSSSSSSPFNRVLSFSVMSYNCLSQTALDYHRDLYRSIPDEKLEWDFRWERIKWELTAFGVDIICLQEVHHEHYDQYYCPLLTEKGYAASYQQRSGDKDDGCAIFFNAAKFECVMSKEINLHTGAGVLDRDNVAILLMLRPKLPDRRTSNRSSSSSSSSSSLPPSICVVTTHILFNMRRGDVKLAQISYILAEVANLLDAYQGLDEGQAGTASALKTIGGVIFTGDFNLEPFSPLHHFLMRGTLKYEGRSSAHLAKANQHGGGRPGSGRLLSSDLLAGVGLTSECRFPAPVSMAAKAAMDRLNSKDDDRDEGVFDPPSTRAKSTQTKNDQPPLPPSPPPPAAPPPPLPAGSPPPSPSSIPLSDSEEFPDASLQPASKPKPVGSSSASASSAPATPSSSTLSPSLSKLRLPPPAGTVRHPFHFRSAYPHRRRDDRSGRTENEISTYHENDMTNVDYILFDDLNTAHLRFSHHKPLPTVGQARQFGKLPNDRNGSDHFSLCANFLLYG